MRVVLGSQLVKACGYFSHNFDDISLRQANHAVVCSVKKRYLLVVA
ncbi:MAG: hypothetical protein ABSE86_34155 [Bryobacteraceae bacterium]|jgi:hypothetical protein